ncbi:hypothetical protein VFPFJ_01779 [Purpureocillium lilacinum]|uniref:Uncharacterized protein n=1 Tax=Purpureocillium lilacinum TaxID=33203 RepID=A0A179HST0_PURLI|nr:hypothetical protein VFPFJ_01779 [Purpureocillium lilacinum]OAQ92618.1 hypothetical protein VFPFJ_01779 [Purpureocillium lilacinum]
MSELGGDEWLPPATGCISHHCGRPGDGSAAARDACNSGARPQRWKLSKPASGYTSVEALGHSRDSKPTTLMRSTSTLSLGANAHNAGSETRQPGRLESPSPGVACCSSTPAVRPYLRGDEGGPGQDMAPWWPW